MSAELIVREADGVSERYWAKLWAARHLIKTLALRDIAVRYKQSIMGWSWAILRPLVTMAAFTIVFEKIARLPSDPSLPYSLMVLAAMAAWVLAATSLQDVAYSITSNVNLVEKVFFPRLVLPIAALGNALLDHLVCMALLLLFMLAYGVAYTWALLALPVFSLLAVSASLSAGVWCAAINVRYRDVRFVVPFALQIGLYVTPIGFSSQLVPDAWKPVFYLNPLASAVDGFRWCVSGGASHLYLPGLVMSVATSSVLLCVGFYYFRKTERTFADFI